MRIALGQINPTVGDIPGNLELCIDFARRAATRDVELVVFPELALTGYPPRDLVEKRGFIERSVAAVEKLAAATKDLPLAVIAGYVGRSPLDTGKQATNCAAITRSGEVLLRQVKMLLPTYDVFDEARNFIPGEQQSLWKAPGGDVALTICEDAWNDKEFWPRPLYPRDPVRELMQR